MKVLDKVEARLTASSDSWRQEMLEVIERVYPKALKSSGFVPIPIRSLRMLLDEFNKAGFPVMQNKGEILSKQDRRKGIAFNKTWFMCNIRFFDNTKES